MAAVSKALERAEEEDFCTIWAFCLSTSAGVRMKHDTSSAREEAAEWIIGRGIRGLPKEETGLTRVSRDFVPS